MKPGPLSALLAHHRPLILDGAMGTELQRRGLNTGLPLWSARALTDSPEVVLQIHRDYLEAGADIITTNTFRTTARTFRRTGIIDRSEELTRRAVSLAHASRAFYPDRTILVAGSLSPLEDCYRPDLVPPDSALQNEHEAQARRLADSGVDFILLETFGTVREAKVACAAAQATGKEVLLSLLCTPNDTLYSGESIEDAVSATLPLRPAGYSVNCVPARSIAFPLAELKRVLKKHGYSTDGPTPAQQGQHGGFCLAAYGNAGRPGEERSDELIEDIGAVEYARLTQEWVQLGAHIVGGCCGTTPEHIAEVSRVFGGIS
jgi:homocysteine S-methyltransferase